MFGKKKEQTLFNAVDDSRTVVYDFRLRSTELGFESYRPADYRLYQKLEEEQMIPKLDDHLEKLFAGEVDDGNGDMLDSILLGAAREALSDLGRQYYGHCDLLRRLIICHMTNRNDVYNVKKEREEERDVMEADYEKTCRMLARDCGEV